MLPLTYCSTASHTPSPSVTSHVTSHTGGVSYWNPHPGLRRSSEAGRGTEGRKEFSAHTAEGVRPWVTHKTSPRAAEEGAAGRSRPRPETGRGAGSEPPRKSLRELRAKGWPTALRGKTAPPADEGSGAAPRTTQVIWTPPPGHFLLTWLGSRTRGTTSSNTASSGMPWRSTRRPSTGARKRVRLFFSLRGNHLVAQHLIRAKAPLAITKYTFYAILCCLIWRTQYRTSPPL